MNLGTVSVRYARALLKAGLGTNAEDALYENMKQLSDTFIQYPKLNIIIDNPMLPKEQKAELLTEACGNNVQPLTKNLIQLVIHEGREKMILFIANAYIQLYRKNKNIINGKLTTAVKVSKETEEKMRQMVQSRTQCTVEFDASVDPDILGGFILEYDTYCMDASVKNQLRRIETELKK